MKTAINTRTQEEYDALIEYGKTQALMTPTSEAWEKYGENTCVVIDLQEKCMFYSPDAYWKEEGYEILSYTEFSKANIVEEPDWKALYLEGRELLDKVCDAYTPETNEQDEIQHKIKLYLTKHNVTPNRDGE